jgi:hypothetical protein
MRVLALASLLVSSALAFVPAPRMQTRARMQMSVADMMGVDVETGA